MVDTLSSLRAAALAAGAAALVLGATPRAAAWGPAAHERVTSEAIDTLPKGLRPFYRAHRLEMPSLSVESRPPTTRPTGASRSTGWCRFPSPTCPAPRPR